MTVHFGHPDERQWRFDVGEPAVAYGIQRDLIALATSAGTAGEEDIQACELIVSEIIGNAVRHAPGAMSIAIAIDSTGVWLHVIDEGPGFEFRSELPEDVWSECGRGLFLIDALARSVRAEPLLGRGSYIRVGLPLSVLEPNHAARLRT